MEVSRSGTSTRMWAIAMAPGSWRHICYTLLHGSCLHKSCVLNKMEKSRNHGSEMLEPFRKNLAFCCSASSSWSSSWWAVKSTQPKNPKIYAVKVMLTGSKFQNGSNYTCEMSKTCCHQPTTLRHCETFPQGQPQTPQRFWNRRPSQPCPINKLSSRKSSLLSVEKTMKSLRKILGICWDNHGCVFLLEEKTWAS